MNGRIMTLIVSLLMSMNVNAQNQIFETKDYKIENEVLTNQDDVIWGFDFISDSEVVFSLRGGALKKLNLKTKIVSNISGIPSVKARGQGGLLDVKVHPKDKSRIYISYSEPVGKSDATTAVGFGTLEGNNLKDFKKIFTGSHPSDERIHFGSRMDFDSKGFLFVTVGDRDDRKKAQLLTHHNGKILRLKEDGSIPDDNPFSKVKDARPEIWSFGHRNPQGLFVDKTSGKIWSAEFGPRGGDEINVIVSGQNYGWPEVTYGSEYWGPSIGKKEKTGMVQPFAHWVPSISPSGLTIYEGSSFPKWRGNIFLANLSSTHIRRLVIAEDKVIQQEELLKSLGHRFRQIKEGPDGFLYYSTDGGLIGRITPKLN